MAAQVDFELADAQTEGQFRQMLRENALAGTINVLLTREPDAFHAAAISGDVYELMLAFDRDTRQLLGGGARFEFDAYLNGEPTCIGYLGELRIQGGLKQRRRLLLNAYRAMREQHDRGRAPFYITTIISDNTSTRRLLEAGLSDMPTYQPVEELLTLTIPTKQAAGIRAPGPDVTAGSPDQLDEIAARLDRTGREYQFQPVWSAATLRSAERCRGIEASDFLVTRDDAGIRGACCLWDQRTFKQTVVLGYSKRLARSRPFFNIVAPILRQPKLPPPGRNIESAFLSHLSIDEGDEAALLALVGEAARKAAERGIDYLMVGLAARNPLSRVLEQRFHCHRYASMIYVVYWDDGRDIVSTIDNRIAHPEVAIL
ncbi:MAG: hypothetical protein QNJ00_13355 [Woeseiaceae bacterium]|nr:hypothetical protein [Woeseiaceae bacterium]